MPPPPPPAVLSNAASPPPPSNPTSFDAQTPVSLFSPSTSILPLHQPPSPPPPSSPPPLAAVEAPPASRTSLRSSRNSALIPRKSTKKPSRSSTLSESIITSMRTPISLDLFSSSWRSDYFRSSAGKLQFGIILGWVTMASMFLYVVFNMLAGQNWEPGYVQVSQFDSLFTVKLNEPDESNGSGSVLCRPSTMGTAAVAVSPTTDCFFLDSLECDHLP
uniref:Protein yipf5 n=1 Tax=Phtheirospermum japonicum TaxID=374723 RepID=A0A830D6F5_9LAMI